MNLILTTHAKKRMIERNIKIREIQESIDIPDYTISKNGKIEAYKKINNKILKIVYLKQDRFIKVITVIEK